jgi:hypothetical protein
MAWNYDNDWDDYVEDPEINYEVIPIGSEIDMSETLYCYVDTYPDKGIAIKSFSDDYKTAELDICGIPYVARICENVDSFQLTPSRPTTKEEDERALDAIMDFVYQSNVDTDWAYFTTWEDTKEPANYDINYDNDGERYTYEYVMLLDPKTLTITQADISFCA